MHNNTNFEFIYDVNKLAKMLSGKKDYYKNTLKKIKYCLNNKGSLYFNHSKMIDRDKGKFTRVMREPLNSINKELNHKILKQYDSHLPLFIYGGVGGKSHLSAAEAHSKFDYNRSYILMDFSNYFEQITKQKLINSLQKLNICSLEVAEVISSLGCVSIGEEIIAEGKQVIARGFSTSTRLAIIGTMKFFKKLDNLLKKELGANKTIISVYVDDISISFDKVSEEKIISIIEKINKLASKEGLVFNQEKTEWFLDTSEVEILGVLVKKGALSITNKFKDKISGKYKEMKNSREKSKIYKSIQGMKRYKNSVKNFIK